MDTQMMLSKSASFQILGKQIENVGTIGLHEACEQGIPKHTFYSFVRENKLFKEMEGYYSVMPHYANRWKMAQMRYPKIIYSWATAIEFHRATENISPFIYASIPKGYSIRKEALHKNFKLVREDEKTHGIGAVEVKDFLGETVIAYSLERCFCDFVSRRFFSLDDEQYFKFLKGAVLDIGIDVHETIDIARKLGIEDEVYYTFQLILPIEDDIR